MNRSAPRRSTDVRGIYDATYFLEQVDGADHWERFNGDPASLYPRARRNLELLEVTAGDRLLEVGCGRGEAAIAAAWLGAHVTAADYSEPALRIAEEKRRTVARAASRTLDVRFVCAPATALEFPTGSFDSVLMAEFIEHIAPDEAGQVLRAVHRWLRPGGRLLIFTYPNRLARRCWPAKRLAYRILRGVRLPERMPDTLHPHYRDYHLNEQSWFSLRRVLRACGFEGRVWFDTPHPAQGRLSAAMSWPWRLANDMNLTALVRRA